jgi:hypothetical protein
VGLQRRAAEEELKCDTIPRYMPPFAMLKEIIHNGWIGCEYRTAGRLFYGRPAGIAVA